MDRTMKRNNEVRFGFRYQDVQYLKRFDNAAAGPEMQIFTNDTLEDDQEPEQRQYWCALCRSKLTYTPHTDTIWKCDNCIEFYDAKIQDTPIMNRIGFKVAPHSDISRYPRMDDEDPTVPFVKSIDLGQQEDPTIEIVKQSLDRRIQHIHVKGSMAEALSAVNEVDDKYY